MTLATKQQPMVTADEHYGAPENTPIRYECDFAPEKPYGEVIVVGKAVAPGGAPVSAMQVQLELPSRRKRASVIGDRRWRRGAFGIDASAPEPFVEMPLTFDRAFGGEDTSRGEGKAVVERRNLAGVGFYPHVASDRLDGLPLPNLEEPTQPIHGPRDHPAPIGFGVLGRAYVQRAAFAGTYDQRWRDEQCPYLPSDFDARYFMSAPEDQWVPRFRVGDVIRCTHMASKPVVEFRIPIVAIAIRFEFANRRVDTTATLDTVIVEPDRARAMLTFRAKQPLGKKPNLLRQVRVGDLPSDDETGLLGYRNGKPHFCSVGAAIRWMPRRRRPS